MPRLLTQLKSARQLDLDLVTTLFNCVLDVVFFAKDADGRYLAVNHTLVERCGLHNARQLVGRTAREAFRPPFGDRYAEQDQRVISSGQPLLGCLEMHLYPTRDPGWCVTNKLPLLDPHDRVVGLIGVSQDLRVPDYDGPEFAQLAEAVHFAESSLTQPPSLQELAARARLSTYQLDRRIRRVFGMSTGQWLIKMRIDAAERRLRDSNQPIVDIALESGYADQSAFARQFRRSTGLTPREYRQMMTSDASTPNNERS